MDEAGDGKEALDKIEHGAYDLILLDVMMPGLNGYQTCMEIRKKSNVPILFLSARTQVEDKIMGVFQRRRRLSSQRPGFSLSGADQQSKSPGAAISCISGQRPEDTGRKKCVAELWKCIRKPELYGKTEKRFL